MKLISYNMCPYVQRARFALEEASIPYEVIFIDPYEEKPDWFLDISPSGKVPVLIVDSIPINNSDVIVEFINDYVGGKYFPDCSIKKATYRMLIKSVDFYHADLRAIYTAKTKSEYSASVSTFNKSMNELNTLLINSNISLEKISMISFYYAPLFNLVNTVNQIIGNELSYNYETLGPWVKSIIDSPAFSKTIDAASTSALVAFVKSKGNTQSFRRVPQSELRN